MPLYNKYSTSKTITFVDTRVPPPLQFGLVIGLEENAERILARIREAFELYLTTQIGAREEDEISLPSAERKALERETAINTIMERWGLESLDQAVPPELRPRVRVNEMVTVQELQWHDVDLVDAGDWSDNFVRAVAKVTRMSLENAGAAWDAMRVVVAERQQSSLKDAAVAVIRPADLKVVADRLTQDIAQTALTQYVYGGYEMRAVLDEPNPQNPEEKFDMGDVNEGLPIYHHNV